MHLMWARVIHLRVTYHIMTLGSTIVDEVEKKTAESTESLALLTQAYNDIVEVLGSALELKDAETLGHCQRVTAFTTAIGNYS
jgi:HD-GYP domain-containing protein (c-di-GMP phosphodiesterase class II)